MCDCCGGTIYITTYTIAQVQPYLTFDELCVGVGTYHADVMQSLHLNWKLTSLIGGKCGSTNIDRNLHLLLSERFKSAFDDLPFTHTGSGSRFMASFETLKQDFGRNNESKIGEIGPLNLDIPDSEHFDEDDRLVLLTQ